MATGGRVRAARGPEQFAAGTGRAHVGPSNHGKGMEPMFTRQKERMKNTMRLPAAYDEGVTAVPPRHQISSRAPLASAALVGEHLLRELAVRRRSA